MTSLDPSSKSNMIRFDFIKENSISKSIDHLVHADLFRPMLWYKNVQPKKLWPCPFRTADKTLIGKQY